MSRRSSLFVAAGLLIGSVGVFIVAAWFHPHEIDPNNHQLSFAQYARADGWTADHLLFFVYWLITCVGLVFLFDGLGLREGLARVVARVGVIAVGATLVLSAMRFLVDGVMLKRAVDAWAGAPAAEQAARFASAEVVRWMEEATISYQSFLLGITLIVLAGLILATATVSRTIGVLIAATAVDYIAIGWILGVAGLAPQGAAPSIVAEVALPLVGVALLINAWRMPSQGTSSARGASMSQRADEMARA